MARLKDYFDALGYLSTLEMTNGRTSEMQEQRLKVNELMRKHRCFKEYEEERNREVSNPIMFRFKQNRLECLMHDRDSSLYVVDLWAVFIGKDRVREFVVEYLEALDGSLDVEWEERTVFWDWFDENREVWDDVMHRLHTAKETCLFDLFRQIEQALAHTIIRFKFSDWNGGS